MEAEDQARAGTIELESTEGESTRAESVVEPQETPKSPQAQSTAEGEQQPKSKDTVSKTGGEEKPKSPDEDFLNALRGFVRRANNQSEPTEKLQRIGRFQAAVLLVVVVDAVLLYSEFQHWFDNPVFQFALKVAPWILGATAFTYSDSVRTWILAHCKRIWLGILALILLFPLLILRQPLFSLRVKVASDSVSVSSEDTRIVAARQEGRVFLVTLPDLSKPYKITIKDESSKSSTPFTITLGRWRVARATFAQIPLLGRLFGASEMGLTPLYQVSTKSDRPGAYADIEGEFQEGFFQSESLARIGCSLTKPTRSGFRAIRCSFQEGRDALTLPLGKYLITVVRDTCKKALPLRAIAQDANDQIDVDSICSQ